MSSVHIVRRVAAPPKRTWSVLTDMAGHAAVMPLTRMRLDPGPIGVGWRFTATTGVGRLAFDDAMVVEVWEPPSDGVSQGRFVIRKIGRVLRGYADVHVEGQAKGPGERQAECPAAGPSETPGETSTLVRWTEEIVVQPSWLGACLAPVVDPAVALLFGRVVGSLAALAEMAAPS